MKPKAIRSLAMLRGTDGLLRLDMVDPGREVVLDPLAERVWDLSDGSRALEDLVQAAGRALDRVIQKEEVFSALDFLADAGLIEERVAPPAAEGKVSRRSLLVQIAPVVGAGACMMLGASARAGGFFQEGSEKSSKETSSKEPGWKESDEKDRSELDRKLDNNAKELSKQARHRAWYESHKGRLDRTGKYAVPPNHPLVGTWKYVAKMSCHPPDCAEITIVLRYYSSGICEALDNNGELNNWKYTSTGRDTTGHDTGVVEEFLGERLDKFDIRWITKDEYETIIPGAIVPRKLYVRQFSSNRRESR